MADYLLKWRYFIENFMSKHPAQGKVLEVGLGDTTCFLANTIGRANFHLLDPRKDDVWKVDFEITLEEVLEHIDEQTYDYVSCCEVLEHVKKPWIAARNLEMITKRGGNILLSLPCNLAYHGDVRHYDDYWRFFYNSAEQLFDDCKVVDKAVCETNVVAYPVGICVFLKRNT